MNPIVRNGWDVRSGNLVIPREGAGSILARSTLE
jgi:hypothetical protein